ncbi:MAG: dTDP-4-dehydrorhamnose 3,5-epimerase [Rhodospirillaceae bacterium]
MIFRETGLDGAWLIEPERIRDGRGYFARTWCVDEFHEHGIGANFLQCGTSYNERRGTLRGIHLQAAPCEEAKLVRCTRGRLYDVMVDLRPDSTTFGRWKAFELSADNGRLVYLPEGFGHGFQTMEDATEIAYQISEIYRPSAALGIRWDDPDLAVSWPTPDAAILSDRDRALPSFERFRATAAAAAPAPRRASA